MGKEGKGLRLGWGNVIIWGVVIDLGRGGSIRRRRMCWRLYL